MHNSVSLHAKIHTRTFELLEQILCFCVDADIIGDVQVMLEHSSSFDYIMSC